jgi:heterodisulfide reductase subunit B
MKVACYYGCLLLRPAEICAYDDPEDPSSMEEIVRALGAEPVSWPMRTECCGGGFSMSRTASVVRLGRAVLDSAKKAGAKALVVACPMCQSNLDFRQKAISASQSPPLSMPIIYLTQLVGVAFGLNSKELGFSRHYVDPASLFDKASSGAIAATQAQEAI